VAAKAMALYDEGASSSYRQPRLHHPQYQQKQRTAHPTMMRSGAAFVPFMHKCDYGLALCCCGNFTIIVDVVSVYNKKPSIPKKTTAAH
jgi:hypothetical protein